MNERGFFMKKIIPFTKDIPFQEGLKEILSISLDHDLSMKNQVLMGNFYLKGKYLTNSEIEDDFSYKIPFEINISDKYDINDTEFYIDGLIEREEIIEEKVEPIKEDNNTVKVEDFLTNINSNNDEKYTTYNIYIFRENDTLNDVMDKYDISKEDLMEYNDLDSLKAGTKLIIPSKKDE